MLAVSPQQYTQEYGEHYESATVEIWEVAAVGKDPRSVLRGLRFRGRLFPAMFAQEDRILAHFAANSVYQLWEIDAGKKGAGNKPVEFDLTKIHKEAGARFTTLPAF
jgi:hypothetical protein